MGGCAFIVCIAGYQPSSLDKFDLSHAQLAATGDAGGKPFIIIDEECYGGVLEQGDWSGRPGYSQIADWSLVLFGETGLLVDTALPSFLASPQPSTALLLHLRHLQSLVLSAVRLSWRQGLYVCQ